MNGNPFFPQPLTPTAAQWTWDTTSYPPTVLAYNNGSSTKTGLQPIDLQNFIGIPLVQNTAPPQPLTDAQLLGIIRQAEDWVEQTSGILLSKAWIASPPVNAAAIPATAIITTSNPVSGQVQGIDYDMYDSGYDFFYRRFLNGR